VGACLAKRAAAELTATAGIRSLTVARLLADLADSYAAGFLPRTVLVVDEAGMVGTRDFKRLLGFAADADTKVVFVGDPAQLPEIDAGGVLRGLATRLPGVVELTENRRQTDSQEREALDHLRAGRAL